MGSGAACTAGAAAAAGASPAGGHGSPPGTRGSPRRSEVVPIVGVAVAVAGAAAGDIAAGTACSAVSARWHAAAGAARGACGGSPGQGRHRCRNLARRRPGLAARHARQAATKLPRSRGGFGHGRGRSGHRRRARCRFQGGGSSSRGGWRCGGGPGGDRFHPGIRRRPGCRFRRDNACGRLASWGPGFTTFDARQAPPNRPRQRCHHDFFRASRALISCGTTSKRSPTTPKSAISKIGASESLLMATIVFAVCMPARC